MAFGLTLLLGSATVQLRVQTSIHPCVPPKRLQQQLLILASR
jgi:hypothetical protein